MDFSPDGRLLASSSLDGTRLWDLGTLTEAGHVPSGETANALFHADGNSFFAYGTSGLQRWPLRRELKRTKDQPDGINVLQVSPPQTLDVPGNWNYAAISRDRKGRWLAVVDYPRGRVVLLAPDEPARKVILPDPGTGGCSLSPDGRWAVTAAQYKLKAWDTSTGQMVREVGRGFGPFSPDGRWLVTTWSEDNVLRYWQVGSWEPGPVLPRRTAKSVGLTFSPGGEMLLAADTPPKLLHAGTGAELATLEAPNNNAGQAPAAFSPDGARLAVGTRNHTIRIWDLRAVRRQLAEIDLDWDLPPYPPAASSHEGKPLRVEVDLGPLGGAKKD
jgi:WD40 repeat protein